MEILENSKIPVTLLDTEIPQEITSLKLHPHSLKKVDGRNYCCDGRSNMHGGCATGKDQSLSKENWYCQECDFDLCMLCFEKYYNTDVPFFIPVPTQTEFAKDKLKPIQSKAFCSFKEHGFRCNGEGKELNLYFGKLGPDIFILCNECV
jgi:hypothetical protein